MFLYKNLFFSISSVISIPIMLIGINGGHFPAICRVCLLLRIGLYWCSVFFTIQRIWIVLGRCLFTHFHDFWSQIGVVILVTPKQEVERKSRWLCGVNFFRSNFKVECENGDWTKIRFLGSGFLFTCGNFTLICTVFSIFWIGFFLNGFPNPFTAHFRPSFLFELNFPLSPVVFLFTCGIWNWFFVFFLKFSSDFFKMVFSIHS